jgi:hypothetical protein
MKPWTPEEIKEFRQRLGLYQKEDQTQAGQFSDHLDHLNLLVAKPIKTSEIFGLESIQVLDSLNLASIEQGPNRSLCNTVHFAILDPMNNLENRLLLAILVITHKMNADNLEFLIARRTIDGS